MAGTVEGGGIKTTDGSGCGEDGGEDETSTVLQEVDGEDIVLASSSWLSATMTSSATSLPDGILSRLITLTLLAGGLFWAAVTMAWASSNAAPLEDSFVSDSKNRSRLLCGKLGLRLKKPIKHTLKFELILTTVAHLIVDMAAGQKKRDLNL